MAKKPKLVLIDSNALIHRAFHALPPMTKSDGVPTNAVYGFTTMLFKVFTTLKPTHVVAAFDLKGPTFRHEAFADYKAHRKPIDEALIPQFDLARDVLRAFGIPIWELSGYEADDIIGTIVKTVGESAQKIIVTGDMDALQLVDDTTSVFTLRKGVTDTVLFTAEAVKDKYGFGPEYIVDYKGLRGDPSDNIPGVAGIGEKTAKDLISQYGSIENIFKHIDDLPKRALTRLQDKEKEALFSRELATIHCTVPIEFSLDDALLAGYDTQKVRDVFYALEFKSLVNRLPEGGANTQPSLFAAKPEATLKEMPSRYVLVETDESAQKLREAIKSAAIVAFDTENEGLGARTYPIVGMSFAVRRGEDIEAWYVPVTSETVTAWKDILEDESIKKTGHNLKYDVQVLLQSGIRLQGIVFDSMLASYLLNPGVGQHSLDALAVSELNYHTIHLTHLIGTGKNQKKVSEVPVADLACYACEDADVALQLYEKLAPRIENQSLTNLLQTIEVPLITVLAVMENSGVKVDTTVLEEMSIRVGARIDELQDLLWKMGGETFNVNSTQQLSKILFEKLNLPASDIKRTQKGYSTAASELEKLRDKHPIIPFIEEYRELAKLKSTYIDSLPQMVDPKTGRIHASFNQTVAATGRLSGADPNLQNIPIRTPIGQEIRKAFIAEEGYMFVKADYSQVELRLAAHMSQDEKMIDVFKAGKDIHAATAAWVHGIPEQEVTDAQRRAAKTLNFGVLYGMGPKAFAATAGISMEEARSYIERYRKQYAGLAAYIDAVIETAKDQGFVETLFGRRRYLPEIHSRTPVIRAQAERMAFNFPLQGTAADILKKAMIELQKKIEGEYSQAKMVLTVHDELVCEVPKKEAKTFSQMMKETMEGVIELDVPLVVDIGVADNWKDAG